MNKQTQTIIAIVIAIILVGLIWFGVNKKQAPTTKEPIKIGGAFGLTGICAEFGVDDKQGAQLAIEEVNQQGGVAGKQIQLITEDTQCDNKNTATAIKKLVELDKVAAIIGPTWGDSFQAGFPIVQNAKVAMISPSTALESLEFAKTPTDYIFSTWFPQRAEIVAIQKYAVSSGVKTFAVVNDQDPFGAMMASLFKEEAPKNGISIVTSEETAIHATDYRTIITKIKAKNPQGIYNSFFSPESNVVFFKQAKELGSKSKLFAPGAIENHELLKNFAKVMEGVVYGYPKNSGSYEKFIGAYRQKYNSEPGPSAANAYDAARILIEALKTGARTGTEIQSQLMQLKIPGTFIKEIKFTDKHQVEGGDFEVKTVKNGKFVRLEE